MPPALAPAAGISVSAVLLFGLRLPLAGYVVLGASLLLALAIDRVLAVDLSLIAAGLVIVSTISVEANLDYPNMALMGAVLSAAVAVPWAIDRYGTKRSIIRFPLRTGQKWTPLEKSYLPAVLVLGWILLPFYFIRSGAYLNWPAIHAPDEVARLFVGVGFVGIWDELFFICVVFAVLRRHLPMWWANVLQAVVFVSFLWELGYREWAPAFTIPFALLQGWIFSKTKSLTYVICVHLLFDLVVFLALVHAHNRDWLRWFVY